MATIVSLQVQYKQNRKSKDEENRKLLKSALLVVQKEVSHNNIIAKQILNIVKSSNLGESTEKNFSFKSYGYKFQSIDWKEYKNILIPYFDGKDIIVYIGWLYLETDYFVNLNRGSIKTLEQYISISENITSDIRKMVEELKI